MFDTKWGVNKHQPAELNMQKALVKLENFNTMLCTVTPWGEGVFSRGSGGSGDIGLDFLLTPICHAHLNYESIHDSVVTASLVLLQ